MKHMGAGFDSDSMLFYMDINTGVEFGIQQWVDWIYNNHRHHDF